MTLDEAIKRAEEVTEMMKALSEESELQGCSMYAIRCGKSAEEHRQLAEWLKELKALKAEPRWIPMIRREPTAEEKAEYLNRNGEELCYMLENKMPTNGQEVLVSTGRFVSADIFDEEFYNFEDHDIENVDAWMPLPEPYEKESEGEK